MIKVTATPVSSLGRFAEFTDGYGVEQRVRASRGEEISKRSEGFDRVVLC